MESNVFITLNARIVRTANDVESCGISLNEVLQLVAPPYNIVGDAYGVDDGVEAFTRYSLQVW